MTVVPITSPDLDALEVSWFSALCSDDYQFLGVPDGALRSSWEHCRDIVLEAEAQGFRNILAPSSYQVGQDTLSFVAGMAPLTSKINMLAAVRCGEMQPIMLARTIATLDHMMKGRLTINIISSDFPGEVADSAYRYQRSREVVEILRQAWSRDEINYAGEIYNFEGVSTDPARPYQQNGGPLLYFGGYSPPGKQLCAEHCDVYLMWPETEEQLYGHMTEMAGKAAELDRNLDFGLRVHVIVRETESEARAAAKSLMSKLPPAEGDEIRNRAQDAKSLGVAKQTAMRDRSDSDGFVEDHLWTGIGRARSGCGAALVGDPDQIHRQIERYMAMGIRSFIFSGYPHSEECDLFAKYVLPNLKTISLPQVQGRQPKNVPATPLGSAQRK